MAVRLLGTAALVLFFAHRFNYYVLRHGTTSDWIFVALAAPLGLAVQRIRPCWAQRLVTFAFFGVFLWLSARGLWTSDAPPDGVPLYRRVGALIVYFAPVALFLCVGFVRQPALVLGAAFGAGLVVWRGPMFAFVASWLFYLARDVVAVAPRSSARLEFAILGAGVVLGVFTVGLAYDIAGTLAYGIAAVDPYAVQVGFIADAPLFRWPRMVTEAGILAACFAVSRGRTWGVFGLGVAAAYVFHWHFGSSGPTYWTSGGCMSSSHPAFDNPALKGALVVVLLLWMGPIIRHFGGRRRLLNLRRPFDWSRRKVH